MSDTDWLADQFEQHRTHLRSVAYRMLGSQNEADDAVQESWIRITRAGTEGVENISGWLTTVTARVCLDMLRTRARRREEPVGADLPEPESSIRTIDPEREALLADSVGPALLVILDSLGPAERLAFVLHDMFGVPFDEIAPIVGRSAEAARQLASRARRRVQRVDAVPESDRTRQREIVEAFLAASRGGDFQALLDVLDPDAVARADETAVQIGAEPEVRGANAVAGTFAGRARGAQPALIDGLAGLVWAQRGVPRVVFQFTVADGKVTQIDLVSDPARIEEFDLVLLGD
jgi:RNA polymerase sigma factor (sigma-70 family)